MTLEEKLLSKIHKTTYCWIWLGGKTSKGYGRFKLDGKYLSPHRLMYELYVGPLEKHLDCCHHCDNPSCVNPEHLFKGTRADNMQDCIAKGRLNSKFPVQKGEQIGNSKLKDSDILVIRELSKTMLRKDIAAFYGVHKSRITRCLNGHSFKHIK